MKEQSHKDEMSAAIRGDFQRLRDRGVAATLAPRDDDDVSAPAEIVPEHDEPPAPAPAVTVEEPVIVLQADDADEPAGDDRPGFLARLLGR